MLLTCNPIINIIWTVSEHQVRVHFITSGELILSIPFYEQRREDRDSMCHKLVQAYYWHEARLLYYLMRLSPFD